MTERVKDLEHLIFVKAFDKHQDTIEAKLALDLRDARRERDDARAHAADFAAEAEQLRARVKELEDQAREYGDGLKPVAAGYYDGIKVQRKYNTLREAVRKAERQLRDSNYDYTDRIEDARQTLRGGLTEDSAQMASNRKPKAYLTRHDLEGGGDE